jgi:hypothetical protein
MLYASISHEAARGNVEGKRMAETAFSDYAESGLAGLHDRKAKNRSKDCNGAMMPERL